MSKVIETGIVINDRLFTGKVEQTDIVDIDIAVVQLLGLVLDRMKVSMPEHKRNKALAKFLNRSEIKDKIAIGQFDEPKEFIKALSTSISKNTDADKRPSIQDRKVELPFIFLARDPSIGFADVTYSSPEQNIGQLTDSDSKVIAEVDKGTLTLSYTMFLVGWDDIDVSKLALHFGMWINLKDSAHSVYYKTVLAGNRLDWLTLELVDRSTVTFDNVSAPFSEGKVRALSALLTINADVARARYLEEVEGRLQAQRGDIHE